MTTKEEAQKLYEGKFFYIVDLVSYENETVTLSGPFDNIFFMTSQNNSLGEKSESPCKYAQVIDAKIVQIFTEKEILVTDRKL